MSWELLAGFAFGLAIAVVTTPVGVSGAVFLLPAQLSVLHIPSPAVTPTNLLYNVVAVPGALARYRRSEPLRSELARRLLAGTLPGVIIGALLRVYLLPGGTVFRVLVAVFLAPLGVSLLRRDRAARPDLRTGQPAVLRLHGSAVTTVAFGAGVIGGLYGIGGGSLLAPILVAAGYLVAEVSPAALLSTFLTSCVGAATYAVLELTGRQDAAPNWPVGLACGLGGLVGGYVGASLAPHLPQLALRRLLGAAALSLSVAYLLIALTN